MALICMFIDNIFTHRYICLNRKVNDNVHKLLLV